MFFNFFFFFYCFLNISKCNMVYYGEEFFLALHLIALYYIIYINIISLNFLNNFFFNNYFHIWLFINNFNCIGDYIYYINYSYSIFGIFSFLCFVKYNISNYIYYPINFFLSKLIFYKESVNSFEISGFYNYISIFTDNFLIKYDR